MLCLSVCLFRLIFGSDGPILTEISLAADISSKLRYFYFRLAVLRGLARSYWCKGSITIAENS